MKICEFLGNCVPEPAPALSPPPPLEHLPSLGYVLGLELLCVAQFVVIIATCLIHLMSFKRQLRNEDIGFHVNPDTDNLVKPQSENATRRQKIYSKSSHPRARSISPSFVANAELNLLSPKEQDSSNDIVVKNAGLNPSLEASESHLDNAEIPDDVFYHDTLNEVDACNQVAPLAVRISDDNLTENIDRNEIKNTNKEIKNKSKESSELPTKKTKKIATSVRVNPKNIFAKPALKLKAPQTDAKPPLSQGKGEGASPNVITGLRGSSKDNHVAPQSNFDPSKETAIKIRPENKKLGKPSFPKPLGSPNTSPRGYANMVQDKIAIKSRLNPADAKKDEVKKPEGNPKISQAKRKTKPAEIPRMSKTVVKKPSVWKPASLKLDALQITSCSTVMFLLPPREIKDAESTQVVFPKLRRTSRRKVRKF